MGLNDEYDDDYGGDDFKSIGEILPGAIAELDRRFRLRCREWPLVKRNHAIVARNRAMKQISEMLDMDYTEMELEQLETV